MQNITHNLFRVQLKCIAISMQNAVTCTSAKLCYRPRDHGIALLTDAQNIPKVQKWLWNKQETRHILPPTQHVNVVLHSNKGTSTPWSCRYPWQCWRWGYVHSPTSSAGSPLPSSPGGTLPWSRGEGGGRKTIYTHTRTHTHTHTPILTHAVMHAWTRRHTPTHTYTPTSSHTYVRTLSHPPPHTPPPTHTPTPTPTFLEVRIVHGSAQFLDQLDGL